MTPTIEPVASPDGHRFELRLFPAAPSAGRAALLWLPALGVPAAKYDALGMALAAHGIDVAIHEWRGLGSSSWRASRSCDWGYRELLAEDLESVLSRLGPHPRRVFAGHSLGAQFAAMLAARDPARCEGLAFVAGGVPDPASFAPRYRWPLAVLARLLPPLVAMVGHFPGRPLRFAGREAATVMRDWAATVRLGAYADYGDGESMERRLADVDVPVLGLAMAEDWMAPPASLQRLLAKLGRGGGQARTVEVLDATMLGVEADHFRWMRRPEPVAGRIAAWLAVSS